MWKHPYCKRFPLQPFIAVLDKQPIIGYDYWKVQKNKAHICVHEYLTRYTGTARIDQEFPVRGVRRHCPLSTCSPKAIRCYPPTLARITLLFLDLPDNTDE